MYIISVYSLHRKYRIVVNANDNIQNYFQFKKTTKQNRPN